MLGDAEEICVVMPPEEHSGDVRQIRSDSKSGDQGCRTKLMELISVPDLPDPDSASLSEFLMDHNDVFALDETEERHT